MVPLVIEPNALAELLNDKSESTEYLVVDLCRDENYQRHHIPGAVHISPSELVSGAKPAVGKLPPIDRLENLLSRIGYDPGKHIIAYDDEGGGWAGRFIWTLDVVGHKMSSYLNGGLIAWADDQLPLTASATKNKNTSVSLTIHPEFLVEKEEVLASLDDANTQIWDARSAEEYQGEKTFAARGGHIPGAINLDWLELMDRQKGLRLRQDIADLVSAKGFDSSNRIITHCQTHHRSGLTYLVGKILDLDIKAYHGSWAEWGNDPDTPIDNPAA
ncbi:MAG: sulfurtransferase [Gammaproteobacteria bacterium]|nr:sulfurtransferase [Gammaproteobacteria bacterium]